MEEEKIASSVVFYCTENSKCKQSINIKYTHVSKCFFEAETMLRIAELAYEYFTIVMHVYSIIKLLTSGVI